jgi:hypothetical protein
MNHCRTKGSNHKAPATVSFTIVLMKDKRHTLPKISCLNCKCVPFSPNFFFESQPMSAIGQVTGSESTGWFMNQVVFFWWFQKASIA